MTELATSAALVIVARTTARDGASAAATTTVGTARTATPAATACAPASHCCNWLRVAPGHRRGNDMAYFLPNTGRQQFVPSTLSLRSCRALAIVLLAVKHITMRTIARGVPVDRGCRKPLSVWFLCARVNGRALTSRPTQAVVIALYQRAHIKWRRANFGQQCL